MTPACNSQEMWESVQGRVTVQSIEIKTRYYVCQNKVFTDICIILA